MIFRAKITIYTKSGKKEFTEDIFTENEKSEREYKREILKEIKDFYEELYPEDETMGYQYEIKRI